MSSLKAFARMRFLFLVGFVTVGFLFAGPASADEFTTIYIVRHAEKLEGSADPSLSEAGQARADELVRMIGGDGIDAVYVTAYARTRETGAPTAVQAGIDTIEYPAGDAQFVVSQILSNHAGERVLVVGHSNTVDDIARALGAENVSDLTEHQYDQLFVIHRFGEEAHFDRLRYGAETP